MSALGTLETSISLLTPFPRSTLVGTKIFNTKGYGSITQREGGGNRPWYLLCDCPLKKWLPIDSDTIIMEIFISLFCTVFAFLGCKANIPVLFFKSWCSISLFLCGSILGV